jgi:hypothetical protein
MSTAQDRTRIAELAQLMLEHRLGLLRKTRIDLDRSKQQLQAIDSAAEPADLPLVAGQTVGLTYERWANVRRSDLNLVIARQTASWIGAREDAGTAFGRLQVLRALFENPGR